MTISMYQASVPVFIHGLSNLSGVLSKAATQVEAKKIDPLVFMHARLAPDMFALPRQVQIAADMAKGCGARLAGVEVPSFADTEMSFPELQERIAKTTAFLKTITAAQVDGSEEKPIQLKFGPREFNFKGQDYLLNFAFPNFYFHSSMVYAILRHNGVEIGKQDFLGGK